MPLHRILLIGASGHLGTPLLSLLLTPPHSTTFTVSVLVRDTSTATFPASVTVHRIPASLPHHSLLEAFTSQDVVIMTTSATTPLDVQKRIARAAADAGVQRFIPADFGSCDSARGSKALELLPELYGVKAEMREYLQGLWDEGSGMGWTSVVCGHFFDYGLGSGLLGFDVRGRKVRLFDGGRGSWSASTLGLVAGSVVGVLRTEEEGTRNRLLYVQSVRTSQVDVLEMLEGLTGERWEREVVDSREYIEQQRRIYDGKREGDKAEARENIVMVAGLIDGDWTERKDFANELLGLKEEDLNDVIRRALQDLEDKK